MGLIDAIVWMWTISAAVGLPFCARSLRSAWVDWLVQHEFAQTGGVPTRATTDRLSVTQQALFGSVLGFITQVAHLAVGVLVLAVDGPLRMLVPLLLLIPQVVAALFAIFDNHIRDSLLRDYANRQERGAASDRQPPRQPRLD